MARAELESVVVMYFSLLATSVDWVYTAFTGLAATWIRFWFSFRIQNTLVWNLLQLHIVDLLHLGQKVFNAIRLPKREH